MNGLIFQPRKGKWLWDGDTFDWEKEYICSECGCHALKKDGHQIRSNFCPNCELRMVEGEDKYKTWLKQNEICVGDEYYDAGEVFVVTNIDNLGVVSIIFTDGSVDELSKKELRECSKTGRHFPEVVELLKKMRGGSNEAD